ncbi:MAG TPA: flavodoxin family protein [Kiritimatiellia bacterium]|nr:flavodoxin family protein [Kiritimatiellia bacterium]HRU71416.1 flavodoxin family protein [Kiritimatiellia bacterium]
MKVVAFNGSPSSDGNTAALLMKVLSPIARAGIDTELVQVGGNMIRGCTACYHCFKAKDKRCVINDDIVNDCIAKMIEADAIIMGSPTYFASMTAEMKALVDRAGLVAVANDRLFSRKIGAAVAVNRRGGAMHVVDAINHMFLMSRMIVPGSIYWNFGVGLQPGDVENDTEGIDNMHDLGETIAWLLKNLHRE